jgi:hypothetical protein
MAVEGARAMGGVAWRYEPLDRHAFPLGEGPFRACGLAYTGALRYVDKRLPGGRAALAAALGPNDPCLAFYEQLFLAVADYDISPLVRLFVAAARIEDVPIGRFIAERARWSGGADSRGVFKWPLHGATLEETAQRLHFAFNRYFPPCQAEPLGARTGRFEGELSRLPACMDGLYAHSTVGFCTGALESAGARDVRVEFEPRTSDGTHAGVPLVRARFTVTWR